MIPIDAEKTYQLAIERALEFCRADNYEVAEVILRQLLRCDSENQEALHLLGSVRHKLGDYKESLEIFQKLESIDEDNPEYHNDLGLALSCRGDLNGAIGHLSKALDLTPIGEKAKRAQYLSNMSVQLRRAGLYEEARIAIMNALNYTDRMDVGIWRNYACLMNDTLQVDESIEAYKEMILIKDDPEFHVDMAYALHLRGELKEACRQYEERYRVFPQFGYLFRHYDPAKLWKGENLNDKTLVVYCEQGVGDTFQFLRYINEVRSKALYKVKIIMHCPESIISLLRNTGLGIYGTGVDEFFTGHLDDSSLKIVEHDYHISLMSLPHIIGQPRLEMYSYWGHNNQLKTSAYIKTPKKIDLGPREKGRLRVGICWAGSPLHPNDARRSVFLKQFEGISKLEGVTLYSFQKDRRPRMYKYGPGAIDFAEGANFEHVDLAPLMTDWDATASLLKEMDLVITVDTALLHLAGAMAVPTWALIPYIPDWRWGLKSESTAWYPSVGLFRQPAHGDWKSVFEEVEEQLQLKLDQNENVLPN